jgi:hypothetical protein
MKHFFSDSPYLSLPASSAVPFDVFQEAKGSWSAFGETVILTSTTHLHYCLYSFAEATNQSLDVKINKNINSTMTTLAIA